MLPQSTSLVSHARALSSFNTVGLHRHHDYAQLFEHFIKKFTRYLCIVESEKHVGNFKYMTEKQETLFSYFFSFSHFMFFIFPTRFQNSFSDAVDTIFNFMSFGLHVATDLNYSSILQGYVKVTVMVLGPGDEAPVSFGSLLRFFFVFVCG